MQTDTTPYTQRPTRPAVVVTGASRGLGAVTARRLADEGFCVFAGMRHPAPIDHPGIVTVPMDVTDPRSVSATAAEITSRVGAQGLAALVNNAAVLDAGPLELVTGEQIDRHLRTNVTGPITTIQQFLPLLRAGRGRIVNVSSINAHLPLPHWGLYSATKAALDALSDALRMELAPWDVGVTVLTLGAFATDVRSRAAASWRADPADDRYEVARATNEALVAMLDATAADPALVANAIVEVLHERTPPARRSVGDGIDDLLALAAQPAETRQQVIGALLAAAVAGS